MLEALENDAYVHSRPCAACDGGGIVTEEQRDRVARRRAKRGAVRTAFLPVGAWCPTCAGSGVRTSHAPVRMTAEEASRARRGPRSGGVAGYTMSDEVLARYATVSRWLGRVPIDLRGYLVAAYEGEHARTGLAGRAADRLGLPADHQLRQSLDAPALVTARVSAVLGELARGTTRETAAGYLWLSERYWDRACGAPGHVSLRVDAEYVRVPVGRVTIHRIATVARLDHRNVERWLQDYGLVNRPEGSDKFVWRWQLARFLPDFYAAYCRLEAGPARCAEKRPN